MGTGTLFTSVKDNQLCSSRGIKYNMCKFVYFRDSCTITLFHCVFCIGRDSRCGAPPICMYFGYPSSIVLGGNHNNFRNSFQRFVPRAHCNVYDHPFIIVIIASFNVEIYNIEPAIFKLNAVPTS